MNNITGKELIGFLESIGCNTRESSEEHTSLWSVYTGDFFVIPSDNGYLDGRCLDHIIWQLGITKESFDLMWNEYKKSEM